ncbi:hypothetical protein XFF4834R_chr39920 [Xanthomonas citri pv. fuscans]|nr:hypothetical protein XFF4834R_chr39920 [Xanthomonas citri pv. fuscans]
MWGRHEVASPNGRRRLRQLPLAFGCACGCAIRAQKRCQQTILRRPIALGARADPYRRTQVCASAACLPHACGSHRCTQPLLPAYTLAGRNPR